MAFSQYDRGSGFTTTGGVYSNYTEFELNKSANQIDPGATVVVAFTTKYLSNPGTVTVRDPAGNKYHKIAERRRIVYSSPGVVDQNQSFELRVYACNVTNSIAQSDEIFVRFPGGYPAGGFLYTISEYRGTSNVSWTVTEHAPNGGYSNDGSGTSATNAAASTENEISDTDWIWFAVTAIWDSSNTSITDPSGFTRAVTAGKSGQSRMWVYHDFTPAGTTNQTFTATFGGTRTWAMTAFALRQSPNFNYSSADEPGAALTGTAQITGFSTGPTLVNGAGSAAATSTLAATTQVRGASHAQAAVAADSQNAASYSLGEVSAGASTALVATNYSTADSTTASLGSTSCQVVGFAVAAVTSGAAVVSTINEAVSQTTAASFAGLTAAQLDALATTTLQASGATTCITAVAVGTTAQSASEVACQVSVSATAGAISGAQSLTALLSEASAAATTSVAATTGQITTATGLVAGIATAQSETPVLSGLPTVLAVSVADVERPTLALTVRTQAAASVFLPSATLATSAVSATHTFCELTAPGPTTATITLSSAAECSAATVSVLAAMHGAATLSGTISVVPAYPLKPCRVVVLPSAARVQTISSSVRSQQVPIASRTEGAGLSVRSATLEEQPRTVVGRCP